MKRHRAFGYSLATVWMPFLASVLGFPEPGLIDSRQEFLHQCRFTVMEIVQDCNLLKVRGRGRRSLERFDQKPDYGSGGPQDYTKARFRTVDPEEEEDSTDEVQPPPEKRETRESFQRILSNAFINLIRVPRRPERNRSPIGSRVIARRAKTDVDSFEDEPLDDYYAVRGLRSSDLLSLELDPEDLEQSYDDTERWTRESSRRDKDWRRDYVKCCSDLHLCRKNADTLVCPYMNYKIRS